MRPRHAPSFQIAYDSDLEFVGEVMRRAAEEELGGTMIERVRFPKGDSR
jgi:hypothetical protein